jgi:hypothetical protein
MEISCEFRRSYEERSKMLEKGLLRYSDDKIDVKSVKKVCKNSLMS